MGLISVISLLVGGLSIMNVMLSSISERIKEIGIRKSLGATSIDIFVQFLTESLTLCVIGGAAGSLVGILPVFFKESVKASTQGAVEPTIYIAHFMYVFIIIVGLGVIFGLYPAFKASRMDPIDALRYE